jgi:hypothetical protein
MLAFVWLCAAPESSRSLDQGTITGVVRDLTGAVISGAHVTLSINDTGLELNTTSDGSGIYIFSPVKIGNYTITGGAPGFTQTSQQHVHLDVGARLNIAINLTPGTATETVTVTSGPPVLQTRSASVDQVLSTTPSTPQRSTDVIGFILRN